MGKMQTSWHFWLKNEYSSYCTSEFIIKGKCKILTKNKITNILGIVFKNRKQGHQYLYIDAGII